MGSTDIPQWCGENPPAREYHTGWANARQGYHPELKNIKKSLDSWYRVGHGADIGGHCIDENSRNRYTRLPFAGMSIDGFFSFPS